LVNKFKGGVGRIWRISNNCPWIGEAPQRIERVWRVMCRRVRADVLRLFILLRGTDATEDGAE
jgi:hypothetical protein